MPIDTKLKEYKDNCEKWALVDAFVDENVNELRKQLRYIDPEDKSEDNICRNKDYKEGAVLSNVTKRTHDGMVGAVYRIQPNIELAKTVEYMNDDADGSGNSLTQVSKKVLSNTMKAGRTGLLVDFPPAIEGATQEQSAGRQARIIEYRSKSIINWKENGGKLVLVVLSECYDDQVDEYEAVVKEQFRELAIIDGVYVQRVWREGVAVSEHIVKGFTGKPLSEITFCFVGTINNDSIIDPSLLYSIAAINKGHYRNSADLEENCFVHGQLTLGITSDLDADAWKQANPNGVKVGARKGHYLGSAGGFHSVQALPNTLADNLMSKKEMQMLQLGARIIQQGGNEREVAVLSRIGAETATLTSLADNVSEAIERALYWADVYMSASPQESEFQLNKDFYPKSMDAQSVMVLIQLYDRSLIAGHDVLSNLKQANIVSDSRTIEEIKAEASEESPLLTSMPTASAETTDGK